MSVPKLTYHSDNQPGFTRSRRGKGFAFFDEQGKPLPRDAPALRRVRSLAIPPAWKNVWICPSENGCLQATGRDAKNRKQHLYHPEWSAYRQAEKFARLKNFAETLPELRRTTAAHLRQQSWTQEKVLALLVSVLDQHHIRLGSVEYRDANGSFGLTTLRRKHLRASGSSATLRFKGKSHQQHEVSIVSPRLARLIRECSELPGYEIFCYLDEERKPRAVDSAEVNAYIRSIIGEEFSSKDFRTWGGTSLAVKHHAQALVLAAAAKGSKSKKTDVQLVRLVAQELGNTQAVCREFYIHPAVLAAVQEEKMPALETVGEDERSRFGGFLEDYEVLAWRLLGES